MSLLEPVSFLRAEILLLSPQRLVSISHCWQIQSFAHIIANVIAAKTAYASHTEISLSKSLFAVAAIAVFLALAADSRICEAEYRRAAF